MLIDIAHPIGGLFRRAAPYVECDLWLCIDEFPESQKFIGAELVQFRNASSLIQHTESLVIGPMPSRQ